MHSTEKLTWPSEGDVRNYVLDWEDLTILENTINFCCCFCLGIYNNA